MFQLVYLWTTQLCYICKKAFITSIIHRIIRGGWITIQSYFKGVLKWLEGHKAPPYSQRKAVPLRSFSQSLKTVLDIWLLSCSYSAMHFRITLKRMPINSPADFKALISAMQTLVEGITDMRIVYARLLNWLPRIFDVLKNWILCHFFLYLINKVVLFIFLLINLMVQSLYRFYASFSIKNGKFVTKVLVLNRVTNQHF